MIFHRTLGLSKSKTFLKVALPLARPAVIAGIMLVAMETLSDFGAVEHFAVPTLPPVFLEHGLE